MRFARSWHREARGTPLVSCSLHKLLFQLRRHITGDPFDPSNVAQ